MKKIFVGILGMLSFLCTVGAGAGQAQMIVKDYQTGTMVATSGENTYRVTTTTTENNSGFNSFSLFNIHEDYTVDFIVPDSANNLINLIHNEPSVLEGTLNSLNTAGQISGNVFLLNPYGFELSGIVNVGTLTLITPTIEFMSSFFEGWNNPLDAAVQAILNGTVPINPSAQIINYGGINSLNDVTFLGGSVVNYGTIYADPDTGAVRLIGDSYAANFGDIHSASLEIRPAAAPVPAPATFLLLGSGLAGLAAVRWRRRQ